MDSSSQGTCFVCGKETATRCGACETAGFDLFFCSREHQKLIWPVHKFVCGPGKANPFLWPDLTKEEADAACEILALPREKQLKSFGRTLPEHIAARVVAPESAYPRIIMSLLKPDDGRLPTLVRQYLLLHSRVAIRCQRVTTLSPDFPRPNIPAMRQDSVPMQDASVFASQFATSLSSSSQSLPPPWLTRVYHYLIVICTVNDLSKQTDPSLARKPVERLKEYLTVGLMESNPVEAKVLLEAFKETVAFLLLAAD